MSSLQTEAQPAPSDWWKDFFSGLFVEMWSRAIPTEVTRAEADFLETALRPQPGDRLLDVACGHGRLAVELASRGHAVTGVDISEEFLALARASAAQRGVAVDWKRGDMQDLATENMFAGAYCMGSSFGYFDDEGNCRALNGVARALRPGGRFVLSTGWLAESVFARFHETLEMQLGDLTFQAKNRWDPVTGRAENLFTVTRGQRSQSPTASHRVYTYRELSAMLEEAGFTDLEAFGSPKGEPFVLGSPGCLVVATIRE